MHDKIRDLTQGGPLEPPLPHRPADHGDELRADRLQHHRYDLAGATELAALAAVGAASVFLWIAASFALINKIGSEVTISQGIGAGRRDEAKSYASQNVCMSLLLSVGDAGDLPALCWQSP